MLPIKNGIPFHIFVVHTLGLVLLGIKKICILENQGIVGLDT